MKETNKETEILWNHIIIYRHDDAFARRIWDRIEEHYNLLPNFSEMNVETLIKNAHYTAKAAAYNKCLPFSCEPDANICWREIGERIVGKLLRD